MKCHEEDTNHRNDKEEEVRKTSDQVRKGSKRAFLQLPDNLCQVLRLALLAKERKLTIHSTKARKCWPRILSINSGLFIVKCHKKKYYNNMRISIINHFACPVCQADFLLSTYKKTKERIIDGELKCKKCGRKFRIKNSIAYFVSPPGKQALDDKKAREIIIKQEIPKTWLKHFSKEELVALRKEWSWMLSVINKKDKNAVHLDFATGTGRFLRNIVSRTKGEIIALDFGYSTCRELAYFFKKIKKYRRVSVVCADARKMPFKDEVFDSATSWVGLDEVKMEKALKEARRVLKKGSFLAVSGLHYKKESESFLLAQKHHINFITKEAVIRTLKKANFKKIEHKIFFSGKWNEKESYLPVFGDSYSTFAIRAQK